MKNEEYISINKIAELKGLNSNRSLRLAIQKGKYIARDVACWLCEKGLTKSSKANERIKNACRKNRRAYGLNWEFIE